LSTLATAVVMFCFCLHLQEVEQEKNQKALDPDFLEADVSVPCSSSDTAGLPELFPLHKQPVFKHRTFVT
jgi:hypothetical protein